MESQADEPVAENPYDHLIQHVQDAVVEFELVDSDPIVRGVNRAFVDIFGYDGAEIRDESLNDWIVPEWLFAEAKQLDQQTGTGEINYQRVKRETSTGLREFLYRGIPYDSRDRSIDGFAVYTDITELTRQQHRLQVLNRVLRHNLRNEANVIIGHTSQLLEQLPDGSAASVGAAATVERAAAKLESLSHEASEIHSVLSATTDTSVIDSVPIVHGILEERRRQFPQAEIEADLPAELPVRANGHLRSAVDGLVENAIEHNPGEQAFVRVRATALDEGWAAIQIDDDAPPIPASEQDIVTGDIEATQTQHGSGLGLWLAKWTAESYGGELLFEESEYGGNSVRLRLPRP
ncbi:sensor histidine kinase [Halobellus clavatus]|uniref:histidine kinase n=1 Tax=Halobellus clavatus TaxID=660517 RepID=A0A1H3FKH6_9EURY|nr:ATP-binding protein [Halobellus clavatus]SDX91501.1 PAS domain S-box-containing protein [Halobellus clavatus]